jgi:hypothetical protein
MENQPVAAGSTPAEVDILGEYTPAELHKWGSDRSFVPDRLKPAEAVDAPEETVEPEPREAEPEPESEPEESQEPKGKGAEKRIKQLLAEKKELERKLAASQPKPDVPAESSPESRQKPTIDDKNPDGTPKYSDWDSYNEDLVDWKTEQKLAEYKREQARQEAQRSFQTQMNEVRERYPDADTVITPAIKVLNEAKLPQSVSEVFGTSPQFFDLCYQVGSDPEKMEKFITLARTDPRAALKQVFLEEDKLQKVKLIPKEAPEPKKTTAPKPPAPVSGATTRAFDVSDESLSEEEWARKRNQELRRKGKV